MNNKEKIKELLEKKLLTEKDKQDLESLIGNDEELREFVYTHNRLSDIVTHSAHLNEDEISEYILYKNGIAPDDDSIIKKLPFIEAHLRKCSGCSGVFKELNSEYSSVDSFISESISHVKRDTTEVPVPAEMMKRRYHTPRYAVASLLIIGLVYLSLYIISSLTTPPYYNDAALNHVSEFSINRGRATEDFQKSLKALEKNDYNSAINYLQKDIRQNPDDETIFYSYYIMGLSYLETAGREFLGLFPHYNIERAGKGIKYLKESVRKNSSGKFTNIKLNSYFYLAKASLMLNDKKSAREFLSLVINGKGSKMDEARKLLDELE